MTRAEIVRRSRIVIALELGCSVDRVTERSDFRTDLKADSLDMVRLPAALEEEFDVTISDDQVEFCKTVGTAIDIIAANIENRKAAA